MQLIVGLELLLLDDGLEVVADGGGGDGGEVEPLAAGLDGGGDLVRLGGARMNFTCSGGSSMVFRRALKAAVVSMWTSSMM
jgi:hypothetical protein